MNEKKLSLTRGSSRHGTVSVVTTVVVIVIIIVLNLIVGRLPKNILQIDISGQKLYSISDTSKEFAKSLDTDIELILLSELGTTDERISKFVDNYAALSGHISVSTVDPVLYPSILETYSASLNSLVVKNPETGKFRVIPFTGTEDALILCTLNFDTFEYSESGFDADGQITSAISYVANDSTGNIYSLTGHGETELGDTVADLIGKSNITLVDTVDILLSGGIPDDCDLLIINGPSNDISSDEADIILDYLANGGDVFLTLSLENAPNWSRVLSAYGMELLPGFSGDTTRYYQQYASFYSYMCIAPVLSSAHEYTMGIDNNAFIIYPRAMELTTPSRDTIAVDDFITTSDTGILYTDETHSETGKFVIGALATEDTAGGQARFTVVLTTSMFSEEILSGLPSMSNSIILTNIITSGFEGASKIAVPAKTLDIELNTINGYGIWSVLYIGVIPLIVFIGGLLYWLGRRKK